jgi:hypothetical protein
MKDVQTCDASAVQIFHELFESYIVRFFIFVLYTSHVTNEFRTHRTVGRRYS